MISFIFNLRSAFSLEIVSTSPLSKLNSAFFFRRHFLADLRFYISLRSRRSSLSSSAALSSVSWPWGNVTWMSSVGLGLLLPFAEVGADLSGAFVCLSTVSASSLYRASGFSTSEYTEAASSIFWRLLIVLGMAA